MNNQQHAPEPWKIGAMESGMVAIDANDGEEVTGFIDSEDARRILACVNACAGIPTDILDHAADFGAAGIQTIESVRKQRDELLAALEDVKLLSAATAAPIIDAAIASVKGGAA